MSRDLKLKIEKLKKENEKLRLELIRDDLTGLYNARHLKERLHTCLNKRLVDGDNPALIFLDVDHFKAINEKHGHVAAGRILTELGVLISQIVRTDDVAFRYGGDEFVILVSGGIDGACLVGERIRRKVESHTFRAFGLQGKAEVKMTVSLGIRVMSAGDTVESVLEAADKAMFEAKRNSRNALVAA